MSLKEQMTEAALRIYPHKTLAQLCYATSLGRIRPKAECIALYHILRSGNIYLTPEWISHLFPISASTLRWLAKGRALGMGG